MLPRAACPRLWQTSRNIPRPSPNVTNADHSIRSSVSFLKPTAIPLRTFSFKAAEPASVTGLTVQQRAAAKRREQIDVDARAMERQFVRDWKVGDVYAPHDLSGAEARKFRKRERPTMDAFDALSLNPLDCYKNFSIMSEYMTEMGRIRHSDDTGLRPVNQRKIAKAIRRAIGLGLMPSIHRHPEIIKRMYLSSQLTGRSG